MDAVELETKEHFAEIYPEGSKDIDTVLYNITKETVRAMIMDEGIRPDNRKLDEIRPIWCETGILPRTHGTGLFKRGQNLLFFPISRAWKTSWATWTLRLREQKSA